MPHDRHHTQLEPLMQPSLPLEEAGWQELLCLLPEDTFEQARIQKAFVRARGLRHPADLLRGILAYVFCLSSFRQVGSWAASIGLCGNGERSWAKRTRQTSSWLLGLVQALLHSDISKPEVALPSRFAGRVHLADATHLRTWKRTGETRRLHMSYDLLGKRLETVLLIDHHAGESLRHFPCQAGDIIVADSAYCRRGTLLDQLDAGVEVLVRLHWSNVPMQQANAEPFDLSAWLTSLSCGQGEQVVWVQWRQRRFPLRLLAQRLSDAAAKRAHRKRRTKARKNGSKNQPLTIQVADWLLLLTSLSEADWSRQHVLDLRRSRWQIELPFKRIKQLVLLHRLRSNDLGSNQAVLAALFVGWTLIEEHANRLRCQIDEQRDPHEAGTRPISSWQVCALLVESLRTMLLECWTWIQIQEHLAQLTRLLTLHPQQRGHQESRICEQLTQLLSLVHHESLGFQLERFFFAYVRTYRMFAPHHVLIHRA